MIGLQIEWRLHGNLPSILVTWNGHGNPPRLHIQYHEMPDMLADQGARVATVRPNHFQKDGMVERRLWLTSCGGFLQVFDNNADFHSKVQPVKRKWRLSVDQLVQAACTDQIGIMEAKNCLVKLGGASSEMSNWGWRVDPIVDALINGLSAEKEQVLGFLESAPDSLLNSLSGKLLILSLEPDKKIGADQIKRIVRLLTIRVNKAADQHSNTLKLLELSAWADYGRSPKSSNGRLIRDWQTAQGAIRGDWQSPDWKPAVNYAAQKAPPGDAMSLLIDHTHIADLDKDTRGYLCKQIAVLIGRLDWKDFQGGWEKIFTDMIDRRDLTHDQRSIILTAFLNRAKSCNVPIYEARSDTANWDKAHFLYKLGARLNSAVQALSDLKIDHQATLAATAGVVCGNPILQDHLIKLIGRTQGDPQLQIKLFAALAAVRAEDVAQDEPLAHLIGNSLSKNDISGLHKAALDALTRFTPFNCGRYLFELTREALAGRLPEPIVPHLLNLTSMHDLFDLDDIATPLLQSTFIERPEWREAILKAWQRVPDPHFVGGAILRDLSAKADIRSLIRPYIPNDDDFADLRDWFADLDDQDRLKQDEKHLLDLISERCELLNRCFCELNYPPTVRLRKPDNINAIDGVLNSFQPHLDNLRNNLSDLNKQREMCVLKGAQVMCVQSTIANFERIEQLLHTQVKMLRDNVRVEEGGIRQMRDLLNQLGNEQNSSGEVSGMLESVRESLGSIIDARNDIGQQRKAAEQALNETRRKKERLKQIINDHAPSDHDEKEIATLTSMVKKIEETICHFDQSFHDKIGGLIQHINTRRQEVTICRDKHLNAWVEKDRMRERRQRLQTRIANRQSEQRRNLRNFRKLLED